MTTEAPTPKRMHIYFVLDRSGSMQSIAPDVIGGFNAFVEAQKAESSNAVMTLVQFDSQDPFEVLADAEKLTKIVPLSAATFVPRGGTPLYDAIGRTIAEAKIRIERRSAKDKPEEEILFIIFTDGEENQSVEYSQDQIASAIKGCEASGWTFVYMGANQDAYAEGAKFAVNEANVSNFIADEKGANLAFASLSRAVSKKQSSLVLGLEQSNLDFFDGEKDADEDARSRTA